LALYFFAAAAVCGALHADGWAGQAYKAAQAKATIEILT